MTTGKGGAFIVGEIDGLADALAEGLCAAGYGPVLRCDDHSPSSPVSASLLVYGAPQACAGDSVETPIHRSRAFAAALPQAGSGAIVMIFDRAALRPQVDCSAGTLFHAGLWTATRNLALSLAPAVRVNALGLGTGAPDAAEVLAAILYLAGAEAVTGQMIELGVAP